MQEYDIIQTSVRKVLSLWIILVFSRFYRKTKLGGFQDMECVPCGDPPPPYEPHCKCSSPPVGVKLTYSFRTFKLKVWQKKNVDDISEEFFAWFIFLFLLVNCFVNTSEQVQHCFTKLYNQSLEDKQSSVLLHGWFQV